MPIVPTATTASITLPGPTGRPAARKVRAKCIRLASSDPCSGIGPLRPLAGGEGGDPPPGAVGRVRWAALPCSQTALSPTSPRPSPPPRAERGRLGSSVTVSHLRSGGFGFDLLQQPRGFAAVQPGD